MNHQHQCYHCKKWIANWLGFYSSGIRTLWVCNQCATTKPEEAKNESPGTKA